MKRKIALFFMIVSMVTCLLAISVSAEVITYNPYEEKVNLTYDETELVTFDDGLSYPSYYIFADSTSFETDYKWLNEKAGKNYSDANVVELYVPNGVLTGGYFKSNSSFTSLLKLNTGKTLTKTNGDFYQNKTLNHVTFGPGYTNEGLSKFFFNGAKVEYLIFDDNSQVTTLPGWFFGEWSTLKGLYLGRSITNLGSGTFSNTPSSNYFLMNTPTDTEAPEVYYFKSTLVEGNFYNLNINAATKVFVFPSTVNGIGSGWNIDNSSTIPKHFVFLTSDADSVVINDTIGSTKLNTRNLYFPNISSENKDGMSVLANTTIYFGKDAMKATYSGGWGQLTAMAESEHLHDVASDRNVDATCTSDASSSTYCFCGLKLSEVTVENSALGHNHSVFLGLIYDSFLNDGYYKYQCERCEDVDMSRTEEALFDCLGYSAPEDGSGGLTIGFTVNVASIENYETVTGKSVRYGAFAVSQAKLGDNSIFDKNGEEAYGVISSDITDYEFASFEIKIVGFNDEQKSMKLAMGAYVAVSDGADTEYCYLQFGTPNVGESYVFVSYNDIANKEVAQ